MLCPSIPHDFIALIMFVEQRRLRSSWRHFTPLRSKYPPQQPFQYYALKMKDQVSHSQNVTRNIVIMYITIVAFIRGNEHRRLWSCRLWSSELNMKATGSSEMLVIPCRATWLLLLLDQCPWRQLTKFTCFYDIYVFSQ
jgi:hypothetical protein